MSISQIAKAATRNTTQQARIDQGEKSGELNSREANRLETRQNSISDRLKRDSFDGGGLSPAEAKRITFAQNRLSQDIHAQKHDVQTIGSATPLISARVDNLQARLDQGVQSGQLNPTEATRLQKKVDGLSTAIADAKSDGEVTKQERNHLQRREDRLSVRLALNKHDGQTVG